MKNEIEIEKKQMPNKEGFFGEYGGAFLPPDVITEMESITESYNKIKES